MSQLEGITTGDAQLLLAKFGPNEITVESRANAFSLFFAQFKSVLVLLLFAACGISFLLGDSVDSIFILIIILLNSILGFVQEYRAERSLSALKKLSIVKTTVIRDGREQEIDSRLLVPGDVVKIEEGDKVPGDGILSETVHLEVNEAALTGESLPVFKKEHEEGHDELYLGTIVARGRGKLTLTATGMGTRFGMLAKDLSQIEDEQTPLGKQLGMLGKRLGIISLLASCTLFAVGILRGTSFIPLFLTSVSLAVAAVPEGLPAIITITLAVGASRLVRQRAIARKMAAIETLGAATLIATDKTGTITKNEMHVREVFVNDKLYELKKHSLTHIDNHIKEILRIGVLANTANLVLRHDGGTYDVIGDPTEGALLLAAQELGYQPQAIREKGELVDEFSFDAERKTMSILWKEGSDVYAYVKGAPEMILERCQTLLVREKAAPLTGKKKEEIGEALSKAAKRGYRVIAVAEKRIQNSEFKIQNLKRDEVESDLTFVGFAAMSDPPRPEVKLAAAQAAMGGIRTIIITGDNELTANAIATEVGLITEGEDILVGKQLDSMSDEELLTILPNARIFARTTPQHKLRIVKLYQQLGYVVAVTGDGINDALALKQGNVGIAMGTTGTDVAKEAADIVITDDNYATIVRAIEEGRVIFDNIVKSVVYLASGNLGEILTILGASLLGLPAPLLPVQILWINLVTDGLPALALAVDPKDPGIMRRSPRVLGQGVLGRDHIGFVLLTGTIVAGIVLSAFMLGSIFLDPGRGQTIAFTLLILLHISIAFFVRKRGRVGWQLSSNKFLLYSTIAVLALQALILFVPPLRAIFKLAPLF